MAHILMILTSHNTLGTTGKRTGWYVPEAAHPWKALVDAGHTCTWASPSGGRPDHYGPTDDAASQAFLATFGADGPETVKLSDVDPAEFDALLVVGGHGAAFDLPVDADMARIGSALAAQGSLIAAVCHGPAALKNIVLPDGSPLVSGKRVAGFTNPEEEAVGLADVVPFLIHDALAELGAITEKADLWQPLVITDGMLVTGQNPASAAGVGKAMVEVLRAA